MSNVLSANLYYLLQGAVVTLWLSTAVIASAMILGIALERSAPSGPEAHERSFRRMSLRCEGSRCS